MKALEKIVEIPIYWDDLKSLSLDEKALLALASYAASESNTISKLYLFSTHKMTGNEIVDSAISIQIMVLLRYWSAKLFEFFESISEISNSRGTKDDNVIRLAKESFDAFSELEELRGYEIARAIRHEATNHYSFKAAKKNIDHVSDRANCKLYLHNKDGNSWYPFGEEVMFSGRLNRAGASLRTKEEKNQLLKDWLDWNLSATRWANKAYELIATELVLDRLPDRNAKQKLLWLEPELVGEIDGRKTPVFLKNGVGR
ncbi:hypothetical protein [uncultured Ruegeria sp.]|uniref:hypothetical protein n=1 Tax=uncultured Ruegeria sp. TaxID=259304 RepID=UPI00262B8B48|nr:hypothetical protein [uncultured Ruegeria sp.]